MATGRGLGTYLKAAFTIRWNLLALFGLGAGSVIAGIPDVVLPLMAAAELLFLGFASTNSTFHRGVDLRLDAAEAKSGAQALGSRFEDLYHGLDEASRTRFDGLRRQCEVLRELAGHETGAVDENVDENVDEMARSHLSGVNRLLWVYLKLLHTQMTLERFFASVNPDELDRLEKQAHDQIGALERRGTGGMAEKKRRSLEDTLATVKARRDNLGRAKENLEFVTLELDRIGAKLSAISELAVNRQDPGLLTQDVDDVARSVQATEQAIGELRSFTGLTAEDDEAPEILTAQRPRQRVAN